jgi:hypothetical protein
MNYQFIENMEEKKLREFIRYIKDSLWRARKFNWLAGMVPVWNEGKEKAEARLLELQNQTV